MSRSMPSKRSVFFIARSIGSLTDVYHALLRLKGLKNAYVDKIYNNLIVFIQVVYAGIPNGRKGPKPPDRSQPDGGYRE